MIHIFSDYTEMDAEIDRVMNLPGMKGKAVLDSVLFEAFAMTQMQVHVITGSLKSSGKPESEIDEIDKRYEGTITYGGPSAGPNNPVDYAIYEKRRLPDENKGNHDFMAGLEVFDPLWVLAMRKVLKG